MPMRAVWIARLPSELVNVALLITLTRFPTYVLLVSNREYRYSAFTVHLSTTARSIPAPSTQPALICEEDTDSPITAGGFQAALDHDCLKFNSANARPPVA